MPYKVMHEGDSWVVHKVDDDGEPMEKMGEHDSEEEAMVQMRALYANEKKSWAVKLAGDGAIEGFGMPYGGPFNGQDLDGEHFSPKTDFAFEWFSERPLLYHHGLDKDAELTVVGRVKSWEAKVDLGVWTKAQLDASSEYFEAIKELIEQGKLFFSSGAMRHLVRVNKKSGEIERWPWVELSLTPTPSNFLAEVETAEKHFEAAGIKAVWSAAMVNDLPDSAFAYIEPGGEEDEEGKTKPRSLRHFPYRDADGELDEAHVRNALGRIPQSTLPQEAKDKALAVIRRAAKELEIEVSEEKATVPRAAEELMAIVGGLPIAPYANIVADMAARLMERTKDLRERRLKEGRVISTANRNRLMQCMKEMQSAMDEMADLLSSTEPPAKAGDVARLRARIRLLKLAV